MYPADEATTQPRQDIDIRTVLIICVSVIAGIIWIAVCCLCACVIMCQRLKSKDQWVIIRPHASISVPYILVHLYFRVEAVQYNLPSVHMHEQRFVTNV